MQITTTMRCYFIPAEVAVIKKVKLQVLRMWRSWNPHTLLVESKNISTTLENSFALPQKGKHMTQQVYFQALYLPKIADNTCLYKTGRRHSNPLQYSCLEIPWTESLWLRTDAHLCKNYNTNVLKSIICDSYPMEATQMSINWWLDKPMWYIHLMECYLAVKRNEVLAYATTRVNLKNIMLSERSQWQKTTYCMMPFIWYIQNRQVYGGVA